MTDSARLLESARQMEDVIRRAQDILSRHVDPGGDLQDPVETVNALLGLLDGSKTLAQQRAARAAIAKAEGRDTKEKTDE